MSYPKFNPDICFVAGLTLYGRNGKVAASAKVGGPSFVSATQPGEINLGVAIDGEAFHVKLCTKSAREFGAALMTAAVLRDAADRAKGAK
ncbi:MULTISPECIES: hypothetical protein [Giesbergeria]|uniref:Uncharacterized protein n=1 Tax=Giesbergeria sinuosa TaxID=80883 RepID=A0ABV9QEY1_9BURK